MSSLSLSLLDRANARAGQTAAQTLAGMIARAQHAESLGYHRFWVAEHHGVPGITGSAPTVLMAAIAARTTSIRVGSGGVMLPNHQPLVVAEQAATLEALYPGRIDLGMGRSVGFTAAVRSALRQDKDAGERFAEDMTELMAFLSGTAPVTAYPRNEAATPLFVLAHGRGLEFAARAGLGVVLGGPSLFDRSRATHAGIDRYRATFQPSAWFDQPAVIVSANIAVADGADAARRSLLPETWALVESRSTGEFPPLDDPERLSGLPKTERQQRLVRQSLATAIHGTPDEVRDQVADLLAFTGAEELLVTSAMYAAADQRRSDELLAQTLLRG